MALTAPKRRRGSGTLYTDSEELNFLSKKPLEILPTDTRKSPSWDTDSRSIFKRLAALRRTHKSPHKFSSLLQAAARLVQPTSFPASLTSIFNNVQSFQIVWHLQVFLLETWACYSVYFVSLRCVVRPFPSLISHPKILHEGQKSMKLIGRFFHPSARLPVSYL